MSGAPRRLNQLGYLSRGRSRHRPRDAAHLYDGPYPFIQTGDVKRATLYVTDYKQTYSQAGLEQSRLWPAGTLCITIAANIADTAILGIDACFPDSVIGFIPHDKMADVRFMKYLFDATIQRRLQRFTQGAAQDNLSQEKLLSIEFAVPSITEQMRVGDILSAYDDLIENNLRRMALLEEAARQLYGEWFVRLRFPGYEHTRIVGGVPDGWNRELLNEHVEFRRGIEPGTSNYDSTQNSGLVRFIRVGDLGGRPRYTFIDPALAEDSLLNPADIVISLDGTVGLVRIGLEGAFSSGIRRVVEKTQGTVGWAFLYELLQSDEIQNTIQAHAKGTTIKHAGTAVEVMQFLRPTISLIQQFDDQVSPLLRQKLNLLRTNESLAAARDLLLPRLMSGEIAV